MTGPASLFDRQKVSSMKNNMQETHIALTDHDVYLVV